MRTPLTAIAGWVDILKRGPIDEKRVSKALEVIDRNVKAQTQIVEDLLNVSRITTGTFRLAMELIDPIPLVGTTIESLRPAIDGKSIAITTDLQEDLGQIYIDPLRWQQVLWNLLANAVKFTPNGGQVQVKFSRFQDFARLIVIDTGEGIDQAFLPHVFERFTQSDSSITRRHGGLGLGLAIVRHIVELHGGQVSVHSDGRGAGSTFVVDVPVPSLY